MAPDAVLVAFDFSEPSRRALSWARLLRARLKAAVTVLHVDVDPLEKSSPFARDAAAWETPEQRERRLVWLRDELKEVVGEVFGPEAQAVELLVVRGQPVEEVSRRALEEGANLIVVGASGKGAVDRLLLGSTTQELVRRSPLPVLTVR